MRQTGNRPLNVIIHFDDLSVVCMITMMLVLSMSMATKLVCLLISSYLLLAGDYHVVSGFTPVTSLLRAVLQNVVTVTLHKMTS